MQEIQTRSATTVAAHPKSVPAHCHTQHFRWACHAANTHSITVDRTLCGDRASGYVQQGSRVRSSTIDAIVTTHPPTVESLKFPRPYHLPGISIDYGSRRHVNLCSSTTLHANRSGMLSPAAACRRPTGRPLASGRVSRTLHATLSIPLQPNVFRPTAAHIAYRPGYSASVGST